MQRNQDDIEHKKNTDYLGGLKGRIMAKWPTTSLLAPRPDGVQAILDKLDGRDDPASCKMKINEIQNVAKKSLGRHAQGVVSIRKANEYLRTDQYAFYMNELSLIKNISNPPKQLHQVDSHLEEKNNIGAANQQQSAGAVPPPEAAAPAATSSIASSSPAWPPMAPPPPASAPSAESIGIDVPPVAIHAPPSPVSRTHIFYHEPHPGERIQPSQDKDKYNDPDPGEQFQKPKKG